MLDSLVRVSRRDVEKHFVRGRSWLSQPSLSLSHGGKMPPCQRAEARSQQESAPSPAQQTHPDSATPPHANRNRMEPWRTEERRVGKECVSTGRSGEGRDIKK